MKSILLTYSNFRLILKSSHACKIARIVHDVLKDRVFRKGKQLYLVEENLIVRQYDTDRQENKLITMISELFSDSFDNFLEVEQELILKEKSFNNICKNTGIKSFLPELNDYLFKEIEFDNYKSQIHFKNGYIDIKTNTFKKRIAPNYILSYINRDYKPSTEKSRNVINKIINQIYPIEEDRNIVLSIISSAFSGFCEIDRSNLFLLGKTSAGKSFMMKMLRIAFEEVYIKEFSSETFAKNNNDRNKILNEFLKYKTIRICWINELSSNKIDDNLFKSFCEGLVTTTSLYKDGFNTINHKAKVIMTANSIPNIIVDSGITSRIIAYDHISEFVNNPKFVDIKNNKYLGNKLLIENIENNNNLKNAIIDILLDHCRLWMETGSIPELSESFNKSKSDIVTSNDSFQDFIDGQLIYTGDDKDKIGKNEMKQAYKDSTDDKYITINTIISSLRSKLCNDKPIIYNGNVRSGGVRGSFIGLKFKEDIIEEEEIIEPKLEIKKMVIIKKNKIIKKKISKSTLDKFDEL